MAWYNPATWTPVDNIQNLISGGANAAMDYSRTGKVNTSGAGLIGGSGGNAVYNYGKPNQSSSKPKNSGAPGVQAPVSGGWAGNTGGNNYNNDGTANSAPSYNPADLAYLDDQESRLKRQYGRADVSLRQGLQDLLDSYNRTRSETNMQRGRELENLGVQREDTLRKKDSALDKVNTNARTLAESLRRRLGMASGSDSSAYKIAAPGAVAREASGQRGDVMEDFGVNFRNLDVTERRAKEDFDKLLGAIEEDKRSRERGLRQGIESQKMSIDESLAELARQRALVTGGGYDQVKAAMKPFTDRMQSRESAIDQLFNKYRNVGKFNPVKVNMPNLRDYMVDRAAIQANEQAGTQDPYAPYRPQLQEDDEELMMA